MLALTLGQLLFISYKLHISPERVPAFEMLILFLSGSGSQRHKYLNIFQCSEERVPSLIPWQGCAAEVTVMTLPPVY